MKATMWKLQNSMKNYEWGSIDMISKLFNIDNPNNMPIAEIWMGAHSLGASIAIDEEGNHTSLHQLIAKEPIHMLGDATYQQYGALPYLFKVLSADTPLSIQVHPKRSKAMLGYEKENKQNISLDSPVRNYKDPNHKPELVYAITPFWALNGFRPIKEIISLFSQLDIDIFKNQVAQLADKPTSDQLKSFFHFILTLTDEQKNNVIPQLANKITSLNSLVVGVIKDIIKKYPNDSGVFAPLFFNTVQLKPGQAMFLHAETPHAYLKGTALEIMANSDNVLRAGLTSKYIDIDELLANTAFESVASTDLLITPLVNKNRTEFPVPVKDFTFDIIHSSMNKQNQKISSAQIVFCLEGQVSLSTSVNMYTLNAGDSVFIAECAQTFSYQGEGIIARAANQ